MSTSSLMTLINGETGNWRKKLGLCVDSPVKMNPFFRITFVITLALALPIAPAFAKPKKKGTAPAPSATPAPNPSNPVEALAPYITNIDQLLALHRYAQGPVAATLNEAPGRLIVLRQEFAMQQSDAPAEKKGRFAAAMKTCDLLTAALTERQKTLGDLASSKAVKSDGELNDPAKKGNLTQGIHGRGLAKAVGSIVERDRERAAEHKAGQETKAGDNALNSMAENQWNQRAIQWRQSIASAYAGIL